MVANLSLATYYSTKYRATLSATLTVYAQNSKKGNEMQTLSTNQVCKNIRHAGAKEKYCRGETKTQFKAVIVSLALSAQQRGKKAVFCQYFNLLLQQPHTCPPSLCTIPKKKKIQKSNHTQPHALSHPLTQIHKKGGWKGKKEKSHQITALIPGDCSRCTS